MRKQTLFLILFAINLGLAAACGSGSEPASESAIPAPPDVAAPPADAQRTASGIASKVLTPGIGTRHPRPN